MHEYNQLCALGLPTRDVIPMALSLLDQMVGGSLFSFIWANDQLEAVDTYLLDPIPDPYAKIYAEEFFNRRELEVGPTFSELLSQKIPVFNFSRLGPKMFQSALFHEVFKPMGMPHALRASVVDGEHRHGVFAITRPAGSGFSQTDEQTIAHAARYLAYGFEMERAGHLVQGATVDGTHEGFLLLNQTGRLEHADALGLRLFHEATRADGLTQQAALVRESLPQALVQQAMTRQPTRETLLSNQRGHFVFRPFLFGAVQPGDKPLVAVTVKRRGSMAWRLWEDAGRFNLSARERQMAVLLGMDHGYDDIASHLTVSRHTAVSYVRRTYEKLGVHSRDQLLRALLAAPDSRG